MPATSPEATAPVVLRYLWLAGGWLLVALVIWLSFTHLPLPGTADGGDKIEHAFAYLALGLWFGSALPSRRYLVLAVALAVFGGAIELGQGMTSYRDMSALDWIADLLGIALGLLIADRAGRHAYEWLCAHWAES